MNREPTTATFTALERQLVVANRQAMSMISSILSQVYISTLIRQFETVDPGLQSTFLKLQTVRTDLLYLSAERDLKRLAKTPRLGMSDILNRVGGLREKLRVIKGEKVDGCFRSVEDPESIPQGQVVLDSIMSKCFCLVAESQA
jgi:hypothetical protein